MDRNWLALVDDRRALAELLANMERRIRRLERRSFSVGSFSITLSEDGSALQVRDNRTGAVTVIAHD